MDAVTKPMKVLFMFSELMEFHRKEYLYISQAKSLEILEKQHGYSIGRRQFNYVLRYLEDNRLINRTKRHKRLPDGRIIPMTSLVFLTKKAYRLIARLFNSTLRALNRGIRKIRSTGVQSKDDPGSQPLSYEDQKEKARELAATLARA